MEARSKVWLEAKGAYLFGDGVADLLKGMDARGSISAAARALGMSYRQAWGHVHKIEERLGIKVVETVVGGKAGGGPGLPRREGNSWRNTDSSERRYAKPLIRRFGRYLDR